MQVRFHSIDGVRPLDVGEFRVDPVRRCSGSSRGLLGSGAARVERVDLSLPGAEAARTTPTA